jgi:hypothetical protein
MSIVNPSSATPLLVSHYGVAPFGFSIKVLFAIQACKFFSEGRRNGSLELLLCTPLTNREIVRSVVNGLWRNFCWPLIGFFVFLFAPLGVHIASGLFSRQVQPTLGAVGGAFLGLIYSVRMLMDLLAITWFGMGMALSIKKPQLAPMLTILFVLILPAILSVCFLDIIADVFFIAWGLAKVQLDLRQRLMQQFTAG